MKKNSPVQCQQKYYITPFTKEVSDGHYISNQPKINALNINSSSRPEVFCKKGALRNFGKFTGKHLCQSPFFNKVAGCNFIKKETMTQLFSCEFCEISKNTFSHRIPPLGASGSTLI